jgi:serine/threonine protein kinase
VLQAAQHDAGSPTPKGVDELAEMIPDVKQHTSAARLIRRLLHPVPSQRPTAQQALDHDFLQTDA